MSLARKRAYGAMYSRLAYTAAKRSPYGRAGLAAARTIQFAYRNRKGIRRVYRRARRSYSGLAAKRRKIGDTPGTGTSKKCAAVPQTNDVAHDTRTLYSEPLVLCSSGDQINQRERSMINVRGWKICLEFKNRSSDPLNINVAILSPKSGIGSSTPIPTADFFRDTMTSDRSKDFGTALDSQDFHCSPINSDKYTILRHKRYQLVPEATGGDTVALSGRSYMTCNWWIPLKRQFRFDAGASYPDSGQVHLVYWADKFMSAGTTPVSPGSFNMSNKSIMYFREPKH